VFADLSSTRGLQMHPAPSTLTRLDRTLRPRETAALVREIAADTTQWRTRVRHDPDERWHRRLLWTPHVEVYLLGWTTDQDTRLHDHGGSVGAFAVTEGQLFEDRGRAGSARLRTVTHATGTVVRFDAAHVHNLGNRGPAAATSIHAYSPPLPFMRFYEPDVDGRLQPAYRLEVDGPEPDDHATPVPLVADLEVAATDRRAADVTVATAPRRRWGARSAEHTAGRRR
jgi:predicted metal-dependent enzyme (double-stranded beta helix superfamily)